MTGGAARRIAALGALLLVAAVALHPAGELRGGGDPGGINLLATVFAAACGAAGAACVVVAVRAFRSLRAAPASGGPAPERRPASLLARVVVFSLCAALFMTPAGSAFLHRLRHRATASAEAHRQLRAGKAGTAHARSAPPLPAAAGLGAGLVLLGLLGAATVRRLRAAGAAPPEQPEDDLDVAVRAAATVLTGPAPGLSPRERVIGCYAAMEDVLAAAGSARRPADTPAELLRRAQATGRVPTGPATTLTHLFSRARFGRHEMAEGDVAAARDALAALGAAPGVGARG